MHVVLVAERRLRRRHPARRPHPRRRRRCACLRAVLINERPSHLTEPDLRARDWGAIANVNVILIPIARLRARRLPKALIGVGVGVEVQYAI